MIIHEVVDEGFKVTAVTWHFHQLVVMIIRNHDVLRISSNIHHLSQTFFKCIFFANFMATMPWPRVLELSHESYLSGFYPKSDSDGEKKVPCMCRANWVEANKRASGFLWREEKPFCRWRLVMASNQLIPAEHFPLRRHNWICIELKAFMLKSTAILNVNFGRKIMHTREKELGL